MADQPQTPEATSNPNTGSARTGHELVADRRAKLHRLRQEFSIDPFGCRVDGLLTLAQARGCYDAAADQAAKANAGDDHRPTATVAGRVVLHRDIGKLVFMTLRDATGDLQVAASKKDLDEKPFRLAKLTDLGDLVVAQGPLGTTKTGEVTVWTTGQDGFRIVTKSLAPPPEKWHGLQDRELRFRRRYVDLYANPDVMNTFIKRSRVLRSIREFLSQPPDEIGPGFIEVETPMMQPVAGGAAARPFTTHHHALDIDLFLRVAPELYLKRLLVGGFSRVFEINRNFRNEGIDHCHNPEFTMLELYQAFGDYRSMMVLAERLIHRLAVEVGGSKRLPFGNHHLDFSLPFERSSYHDLFAVHNGFDASNHSKLVDRARELGLGHADKDHDVLLQDVWEHTVEDKLIQPTFVIDYPAGLCPLTKTKTGDSALAERFELYVAGMEIANAYTELNDPDTQQANFEHQITGLNDEEATFRTMDHDFIDALCVGMPPAGGLGIGVDRLVMLMTNRQSIRDVILFPLMRPSEPSVTERSIPAAANTLPNGKT